MSRRWIRRGVAMLVIVLSVAIASGAATSDLRISPQVVVIGTTTGGSGAASLINNSTQTITITGLQPNGSCPMGMGPHVSQMFPMMIPAGQSRALVLGCPQSSTGFQRCVFDVMSNATPLGTVVQICTGPTMPTLNATPSPHNFGTVGVGGTQTQTFTISKPTPAGISTMAHLQLGDIDGNFTLQSPCGADGSYCFANITLGNGSNQAVDIACSPTKSGPLSSKFYMFTQDMSGNFSLSTPVDLTCNGGVSMMPTYDRQPGSVMLQARVKNEIAMQSVTVTNTGSGTVNISDVSLTGVADWQIASISGKCNTDVCSLANLETLSINLTFDPDVRNDRNATLQITHDTIVDSLMLTGLGLEATADLVSPSTIVFNNVPLSTAATTNLSIENRGNTTGDVTFVHTGNTQIGIAPVQLTLPMSQTTAAMVSCRSDVAGDFTAQIMVNPGISVTTPPYTVDVECHVRATSFFALPTMADFPDLRTGRSYPGQSFTVDAVNGPAVVVSTIELADTSNFRLVKPPLPATTPFSFTLEPTPITDDPMIDNKIIITPATVTEQVQPIEIAITGSVGTSAFAAPQSLSLGSFCVKLPTTPLGVELESTGTAKLDVAPPTLQQQTNSALELDLAQLATYPRTLLPGEKASIDVSPKRRDNPGVVSDMLQWSTDAGSASTELSATFIAEGAAVTPNHLDFEQVEVHLMAQNAVEVHLQNCNEDRIDIDSITIPLPFAIDNGIVPMKLDPGETAVFAIGFHPTDVGRYEEQLVIESVQLDAPLVVTLVGEGIPGDGDNGDDDIFEQTSFYACGCSGSRDPSGVIALAIALVCVVLPRRHPRRTARR